LKLPTVVTPAKQHHANYIYIHRNHIVLFNFLLLTLYTLLILVRFCDKEALIKDGRVWLGCWFNCDVYGGGGCAFVSPIDNGSIATTFFFCTPYIPSGLGRHFHFPPSSI
jgi:hypothetical protein